jgi:peptide/nickel transport system ATP-binding protein
MTPSLLHLPQGCAFRPRCTHATDACLQVPQVSARPGGGALRCWNPLA